MSNKNSYYFPHDYNARNDPKLQKIMAELGHEGKSVFWDLVEMMYEQGGKLPLDGINGYAFALHTNSECITKLISIAFKTDKTYFWSQSVLDRLAIREEKSQKARKSAQRRWDKDDANALRSQCDSNANKIKENKRKENIYNSIESLTEIEIRQIAEQYRVSEKTVAGQLDIMKSWLKSKGKRYKDYYAALQGWIRRKIDENPSLIIRNQPTQYVPELPNVPVNHEKLAEIRRQVYQKIGRHE